MAIARIQRMTLRAGAKPASPPRIVELSPVTVLVGPNNGGKSTALGDLTRFAEQGNQNPQPPWAGTVLSEVEFEAPSSKASVLDFLAPQIQEFLGEGTVWVKNFRLWGGEAGLRAFTPDELDPAVFSPEEVGLRLLALHTISLTGRDRFNLAGGVQTGPLNEPPNSHWMAVEREEENYAEVNRMIEAAFGQHLVIQTYQPPQLVPALSPEPLSEELRHSTSQQAIERQQAAIPLNELSDGVQVFTGLVAAIATFPHLLILIDEPEAFLHPTLSRRLGANLAEIAVQRDARLIVATHSADFLLGCLEEVPQTSVLRLDYQGGVASSYALSADDVADLSRNPLLRSADALQALFSRSAVVCEADSDRAFYAEINRRLLQADGRSGAEDCTFLNAQNWQTTVKLAEPLRKAGVPAAIVLDLDVLGRDDAWPELIAMGDPSNDERNRLNAARTAARDAILECGRFEPDGPLKVKTHGLDALSQEQKGVVEQALADLGEVGVFLVNVGELEKWLPQFGCTNKQRWVTDILSRLGSSGGPAYVVPGPGDVWAFVERVAVWLENPQRQGLPER